jgi:phosphate starvation-inducible PhoH-like protein
MESLHDNRAPGDASASGSFFSGQKELSSNLDSEVTEFVYPPSSNYQDLFGCGDRNVKAVEQRYGVQVVCRDGALKIIGDKSSVRKAAKLINEMDTLIQSGAHIDEHTLTSALEYLENGGTECRVGFDTVVLNASNRQIRPRSLGQCIYLSAMMENDVVFSIGPAGTGKTFLAVALAVSALKNNRVKKLILCRPAVEAGESLGFLPGDLKDKVEPYFRPLYDSLYDTLGPEKLAKLEERGIIEVAPLAYMRGRTLNDAYIILDEAQNTTTRQMKMLLTRLGINSKLVVTGDITQIDLPHNEPSGLTEIESILGGIEGVAFVRLTGKDVVRHRLVQDIIQAYSEHDARKNTLTDRHAGRAEKDDRSAASSDASTGGSNRG